MSHLSAKQSVIDSRRKVVNYIGLSLWEVVFNLNGAGKTTTFYMIVGLIRLTVIYLDGEDISQIPDVQRARKVLEFAQEPSVGLQADRRRNILAILETIYGESERKERLKELQVN